jgi:hypothetical protein
MIDNNTIYSVLHIRSITTQGEEEQVVKDYRWFESLYWATAYFKLIKLAVSASSPGKHTKDFRQLFRFALGDEAGAILASNPKYAAGQLAWALDLKPSSGELLEQEPAVIST